MNSLAALITIKARLVIKASGYSKSFMQYMERADARAVLEVVGRTPHTAIYYVGDSLTGVFADADY